MKLKHPNFCFVTNFRKIVSRKEIESGNTEIFLGYLDKVEGESGKWARNQLVLLFEGPERNFIETGEVLSNYFIHSEYFQWIQQVFAKRPHLFYYLTEKETMSRLFFLSLAVLDSNTLNDAYPLIDSNNPINIELLSLVIQRTLQHAYEKGNSLSEIEDLCNKLNFAIFPYKVDFDKQKESITVYRRVEFDGNKNFKNIYK